MFRRWWEIEQAGRTTGQQQQQQQPPNAARPPTAPRPRTSAVKGWRMIMSASMTSTQSSLMSFLASQSMMAAGLL